MLGILVLALSVELASSADVYIYIIGAGCWIGIPSREFSVGVESWIGILNSKQILVVGVVRMHLVSWSLARSRIPQCARERRLVARGRDARETDQTFSALDAVFSFTSVG